MAPAVPVVRAVPGRAQAVALAALIGIVAGLIEVVPWVFIDPGDALIALAIAMFVVGITTLAAASAAWIVCLGMNRWRVKRVVGVLALAATTYLCGILMIPALLALVNLPNVLGGGPLPCIQFDGDCQSGFHGLEAVRALLFTTLETYGLCIYALLLLPYATAMLLIPAAVWDVVARRRGWIRPGGPPADVPPQPRWGVVQ